MTRLLLAEGKHLGLRRNPSVVHSIFISSTIKMYCPQTCVPRRLRACGGDTSVQRRVTRVGRVAGTGPSLRAVPGVATTGGPIPVCNGTNNSCPGLGNLFVLKNVNLNNPTTLTGGLQLFANASIDESGGGASGGCVGLYDATPGGVHTSQQDSMESLVKSYAAALDVQGTYSTQAVAVSGSVQGSVQMDSALTTTS